MSAPGDVDPYRSGAYASDNPDWHAGDAPHKAAAVARALRRLGVRPSTVADVGCGSGDVLVHLTRELGPELPRTTFEGWDLAPEAIRRARRHPQDRVTFVEGDVLASERRFDLILLLDVLEHVPDEVAFLSALAERAQGFLLRLPLDLCVLDVARPGRVLEARRRYGHRHPWTRELALRVVEEAGLQVEAEWYDRIPVPNDSPRRRLTGAARTFAFAVDPHRTVRWLGGWSLLVWARPG